MDEEWQRTALLAHPPERPHPPGKRQTKPMDMSAIFKHLWERDDGCFNRL
jgi:hypothetical protein